MNTATLAEELAAAGARRVEVRYNARTHDLTVVAESPTVVALSSALYEFMVPHWPYCVRRHGLTKTGMCTSRIRWDIRLVPEG